MANPIERFHKCASCRHFAIEKTEGKITTRCARLGYETKPFYQFDCWDPKPRVKKALEEELRRAGGKRIE